MMPGTQLPEPLRAPVRTLLEEELRKEKYPSWKDVRRPFLLLAEALEAGEVPSLREHLQSFKLGKDGPTAWDQMKKVVALERERRRYGRYAAIAFSLTATFGALTAALASTSAKGAMGAGILTVLAAAAGTHFLLKWAEKEDALIQPLWDSLQGLRAWGG